MKRMSGLGILLAAMTIFSVGQVAYSAETTAPTAPQYDAVSPTPALPPASVVAPAATTVPVSTPTEPTTSAPASASKSTGTEISSQETTTMSSKLPDPVGRVVWVKGVFTAVMPNNEKRQLQKTSLIYVNDTLSTDSNTKAEIVFTDNTLMTFRPNTKFYIDQYSYKPSKKKGSVGTYVMNLIEGGFRTITGLIPKANPPDYQVNTPVATIGVRGTDYVVYVKNGELFLGLNKGKPCVKNSKGDLCLDSNTRFAKTTANTAPVALTEEPAVFKEKLEITPAVIAPFAGSGGSSGGTSSGGSVSSFCIQ